jgi:hypothetical protein
VARRCVWSRNLENEEAKARYRAVENTTTMGCNARKTNSNNTFSLHKIFVEANKLNNMGIIFLLAWRKLQCPTVVKLILLQGYVFSYDTFLQDVTSCLSYSTFELCCFALQRNRPHFANRKHSASLFFKVLSPTNFINNLVTRSVMRVI